MKLTVTTSPCPRCSGSGKLPDPASLGAALRSIRIAKLGPRSGASIARALGVCPPFLCDMEQGKRGITTQRKAAYLAAVDRLAKERRI